MAPLTGGDGRKEGGRKNDPYLKRSIQNKIINLAGINMKQEFTWRILKVNNLPFKQGW